MNNVWRMIDIASDYVNKGDNVLFMSSQLKEKELCRRVSGLINKNNSDDDSDGLVYIQEVNSPYTPDFLYNLICGVEFQIEKKIDIVIIDSFKMLTLNSDIQNLYLKYHLINDKLNDIVQNKDISLCFPLFKN